MVTKEIAAISHYMTQETIATFLQHEKDNGANDNALRRYRGTLKVIYDYLPEDKCITKERLLAWRKGMEESGYASITVLNYVKYINRYLDFVGCSEIRFNRGKAKDISGMTFGYLTAIEPTGEKKRGDLVWLFECKCGNTVELPATRALMGNTLSCGCLKGAHFKKTMKIIDGTSLVMSMTEKVESTRAISGYTGVTPRRDKWQAYINYKGVHYSLGCYHNVEDAVKARARAKELVMADAAGLLDFFTEWEKTFPQLPNKSNVPKKHFASTEWTINNAPTSMATRSDNTSGCPGVNFHRGKWDVKISYQNIRYQIGRYTDLEDAVSARRNAEKLLKEDPQRFIEEYKDYPQHSTQKKKILA